MGEVTGVDDYLDTENVDGRVRMRIAGVEYRLKRPTIKEFRYLRERLNEMAAESVRANAARQQAESEAEAAVDVVEQTDDASPDVEPEDVVTQALARLERQAAALDDGEDALVEWWASDVFPALEERGQAFPRDDAPVWLLSPKIVPAMMECWLNRPVHPGV